MCLARTLTTHPSVLLALTLVLGDDAPLAWSWCWLIAMVVVAAITLRRRAPEVPAAFSLALIALSSTAVISLGVLFGAGIFPMTPRTVVPLAGMVIGLSTRLFTTDDRLVELPAEE